MMKHIVSIPLLLLILLLFVINVKSNSSNSGCSMKDVMTCVVQLKSYNVPIDTNMMNVVFNVSTEAKLVHVCRAYNNAMPCFKQRLATCANEKQRIRLEEVNRLLLFICAPFSLQRQKTLLKVGKCIGEVLNHPVEPNCSSTKHRFWHKLRLCRDNCESNDVVCQMRVRMSELAVCSVIAIEKQCGRQAADFYSYMQTAIIAEEFPIQCKYDYAADKIRKLLNSQEFLNEEVYKNIQPPSQQFIVQELVLPKSETTTLKKPKESSQISSSSNENNLIKGSRISSSSSFNYTKKALRIFQNDRKKTTTINENSNNKTNEENDSQEEAEEEVQQQKQQQQLKKEKTKAIRTRNFSKLFRPSKFAEINLKKYQPPENTVIVQLFPTKESLENMTSNSKEKSSNEQQLPAFLQGARPIPDSSSMGRSIILPKTTYVFSKEIPSKEFLKGTSKSKEIKSTENTEATKLAGVREIYNPNVGSNLKSSTSTPLLSATEESSTLIFSFTSTTTTTPLSPPSVTTTTSPTPMTITFTETIPVQTATLPSSSTTTTTFTNVIDDTTQNKFYPWYYNSLSKQINNNSMVTTNPIFPYFNPKTLSSLPKPPTAAFDPYYNNNNNQQQQQINNFDPNAFAANFVSRINLKGFLTTTTPSTSDDIAKLLNMPDFKEKADTILSTAIDVLKPHNKYQQPFADVPDNGLHHSPSMNSYSNQQNKTASGAFTELMETIKKISPTVLDNIREKLNNLGHN